jgi:hypothetical protein
MNNLIASYFGSPKGLMDYLAYMLWLGKRHPELLEKSEEHPNPDLEYESYRDSVDDDFRGAAEAQGMSEEQIEEAISSLTEEELIEYAREWDVENNMWK